MLKKIIEKYAINEIKLTPEMKELRDPLVQYFDGKSFDIKSFELIPQKFDVTTSFGGAPYIKALYIMKVNIEDVLLKKGPKDVKRKLEGIILASVKINLSSDYKDGKVIYRIYDPDIEPIGVEKILIDGIEVKLTKNIINKIINKIDKKTIKRLQIKVKEKIFERIFNDLSKFSKEYTLWKQYEELFIRKKELEKAEENKKLNELIKEAKKDGYKDEDILIAGDRIFASKKLSKLNEKQINELKEKVKNLDIFYNYADSNISDKEKEYKNTLKAICNITDGIIYYWNIYFDNTEEISKIKVCS